MAKEDSLFFYSLLFFSKICLLFFALFLPWHGAITVFLPPIFRFWKEGLIVLLFLIVLILEFRLWWRHVWPRNYISSFFAFSFLVWIGVLLFLNDDPSTAAIAARYLGMGVLVFLLVSRLLQHLDALKKKEWIAQFSSFFIFSAFLSVLFATWAKFLGGFEILKHFYSQTISSWVPGQIIPLYHETSGHIRFQGASSGPTEFSHLLFVGIFLLPFLRVKKWIKIFLGIVFLFGILESFSRAAFLGTVLFFLFLFWKDIIGFLKKKNFPPRIVRQFFIIFICIFGLFALFFGQERSLFTRSGTAEHFFRPIEAFRLGLHSPIVGQLGKIGPAARSKNLEENHDDTAMISENVFVDIFVQTGILGVLFIFGFFVFCFLESESLGKIFILISFLLANMATLFDMTPIALAFFLVFAFFLKRDTKIKR